MENRPTNNYQRTDASNAAGAQGAPGAQTRGAAPSRMSVSNLGPAAGGAATPGATGTAAAARRGGGQAKPSGKRTALLVVGIVVAALAIWLLVWLFACNGSSLFDPNAQTGQAPYKSQEEMQAELDRVVEEGMFNISIASTIQFADGSSSGTAYIENVPGNQYNMQVTITQDASGDVLYESGILSPNQYIENITLTEDLDPGTYEATATFTALDPTTYEEVGQAAAKIAIVVQG